MDQNFKAAELEFAVYYAIFNITITIAAIAGSSFYIIAALFAAIVAIILNHALEAYQGSFY